MIRRRTALGRLGAGAGAASALGGWAGLAAGLAQARTPVPATTTAAAAFEFIALGDMPYGPDAIAGAAYRHLIGMVNQLNPPFSLHVGDFKSGVAACSDSEYALQQRNFQRFEHPLVYTPGDNDWFDCQRRGDDPLERLQALRQRFFAAPRSLGQRPLALLRQADVMPAFAAYVENLRWTYPAGPQGVVFASFHTLGPDNGFDAASAAVRAEALTREAANAAWISAAFAAARSQGARALVLMTQGESLRYREHQHQPLLGEVREGFAHSIGQTLLPLAEAAPHPVLLIHGDGHHYTVDQPFQNPLHQPIQNLWRLEVFGNPRMHAVRVRVNRADAPGPPFGFTPVWNPLSPDPRLRAREQP